MDFSFRSARPDDVENAVPLVFSSGPACFDYVFSHKTRVDAKGFLRRAFKKSGGEFGFAGHRVGVVDGEVVAIGAFFSGREALPYMVAALAGIIACYGPVAGAGVVRRGLQVERIVQPPKADLHYVCHIGVAPEFRGQGLGARVMDHLMVIGRERGRTLAALDVSVENPRAQALYERLGFKVVQEHESTYGNATATVPNHRRMERALA